MPVLTRQLQVPQEQAWLPEPALAGRYRWEAIADAYEALCCGAAAP